MITFWSRGAADENMPEELLVRTLDRVRRHPWWHARARLALDVLRRQGWPPPARVLDVGCGWGVNLDALEAAGFQALGLDISRQILERIDRPGRRLIEADLNQDFPRDAAPTDALLALDVLEHLDDDAAVVRRLAGLLRPGGIAIISVPARPDLTSEFDEIQGHRRRYEPSRLKSAFEGSGLEVRQIFWWGSFLVPVLRRMRREPSSQSQSKSKTYADYLRLPPWPAPWLLKLALAWEHHRALLGRLTTGTSLFAVAVRPQEPPANRSQ